MSTRESCRGNKRHSLVSREEVLKSPRALDGPRLAARFDRDRRSRPPVLTSEDGPAHCVVRACDFRGPRRYARGPSSGTGRARSPFIRRGRRNRTGSSRAVKTSYRYGKTTNIILKKSRTIPYRSKESAERFRPVTPSTGSARLTDPPSGWMKGAARSRSRERSECDLGRACLSQRPTGRGRLRDPYLRRVLLRGADMSRNDRDRAGAFEEVTSPYSAVDTDDQIVSKTLTSRPKLGADER
jgi:hypothetical protein